MTILKSETFKLPGDPSPVVTTPTEFIKGNCPLATPVTVVIPVTVASFPLMAVTLANVTSFPMPLKASKSFNFNFSGNKELGLVTVLNPVVPLTTDIVASPKKSASC